MATLIPSLGTCVSRMTSGEKRLAQRLEDKLDDDYLLWYDVPMGPKNAHPDFCVMHPSRGILVLEVKDWKLPTIQQADKQTWTIIPDGIPKSVTNPLEQARQYAHQVVNALERDPQLVQPGGPYTGKLALPVLSNARDVTSIGHWGTGNLEVPLASQADLDAVKPFINAAYEGRG